MWGRDHVALRLAMPDFIAMNLVFHVGPNCEA
jgi:hypothetical protein